MPKALMVSLSALVLFLVVACNDADDSTPLATDDGSPSPTATAEATPTEGTTGTSTPPGGTGSGGPDGVWDDSVLDLRDGTWPVGDAGEIEFTADGGGLELVEVRPADGWTVTEREVDADEIEVDFRRDNVEWWIEVELKDGELEIEIDQEIEGADPGVYTVGLAGTVEFELVDGRLSLVEALTNEGWTATVEEQDADEIEVDFRMGNVQWDFKVDLDDGVIDVEIDFEIEGRYPTEG